MYDMITAAAHKIFVGKPAIHRKITAVYTPPPTNAEALNPWNGSLSPITSITALILFSSPADVAKLMPLLLQMDPATRAFDGSGIICPEIQYGSDGRKVNCVEGNITIAGVTYAYQAALGVLVAAQQWGPGWNGGNQAPYTKLVCDAIDPSDAQVNWSH